MELITSPQELEVFQTIKQWIEQKRVKTSLDTEKLLFKTFPMVTQMDSIRLVQKYCNYRKKIEAILQDVTMENPQHVSPSDCEATS